MPVSSGLLKYVNLISQNCSETTSKLYIIYREIFIISNAVYRSAKLWKAQGEAILNVGSKNRLNFVATSQNRFQNVGNYADKRLNFQGITVSTGWQKRLNHLDMTEAVRRGVLGLVVLAVKAPSDFISNKDKDEKTRWVSCLKIVDKIVVGTISGCTARWLGQLAADNLTGIKKGLTKIKNPELAKKAIDPKLFGLASGSSIARMLAYVVTFISMVSFDWPVMSRVIQATTNWVEKSIKSEPKKLTPPTKSKEVLHA